MTRVLPYGSWPSPIGADEVAREAGRLSEPQLDGDRLYWCERRPHEAGRTTVLEWREGSPRDRTPEPLNVRTSAHEYGGGAYVVEAETLYFSGFADGRLYRQAGEESPRPITPEAAASYADLHFDAHFRRLLAVRELAAEPEPLAAIVAVDPTGGDEPEVLVEGDDFYSNPRPSPDGRLLAWLSWSHPNMPWDGTRLWLAERDESGRPLAPRVVAGGDSESIFQPELGPDGALYFVSDRSGWWNLYRLEDGEPCPLAPKEAEFGWPQWLFGMRSYALASESTVVCSFVQNGVWSLARLEVGSPKGSPSGSQSGSLGLSVIEQPFTRIEGLVASPRRAVFVGAAPDRPSSLVELDLERGQIEVLRTLGKTPDPRFLSVGESIRFPAADGGQAQAFFYRPTPGDCEAPKNERPPLLVKSHGGPTAAADNGYDIAVQYWTSRGFAVVDVNYGGSTGFGRRYRERLEGRWGEVDVDDCVAAARYLAEQNEVDSRRLAIRGGSAGGYTTLAALAFRDVFAAGASHYGIGDLEALARDTHKFESRYLDRLVGPYPQQRELYRRRSPLHSAERLSCPVIFFQGLDDKVVPPNQAETMVAALAEKGVKVALVTFEGEGHGFRRAENIARALEAELWFYGEIFGFSPADELEPVPLIEASDEA